MPECPITVNLDQSSVSFSCEKAAECFATPYLEGSLKLANTSADSSRRLYAEAHLEILVDMNVLSIGSNCTTIQNHEEAVKNGPIPPRRGL